MHGGDSIFGRMTTTTHVYRDSGVDSELDHKAFKVTEKLSESINTIANEPSVAFYRIQEHVRKTLPQLVEQKHEVEEVQQLVQGACFDTEYAGNAVKGMQKSVVHFQNIQELLKNAMFMKQQIDYEEARKRQGRAATGGNGRAEGQNGGKVEEVSESTMDDSAVSTDSSLVASAHMCSDTQDGNEVRAERRGEWTTGDEQQEKDAAGADHIQQKTGITELEDRQEEKDREEEDHVHQEKNLPDFQERNLPDFQDRNLPDFQDRNQRALSETDDKEERDLPDTEDTEQRDLLDSKEGDLPDMEDPEDTGDSGGNKEEGKKATERQQTQSTAPEEQPESGNQARGS